MWYIIQTRAGDEELVTEMMKCLANAGSFADVFIPMYEEVRRSEGRSRIILRRMFPGYIFVETDDPDHIFGVLKTIPEFTRLLGAREKDGSVIFIPVGDEDRRFLDSILEDGIMHVSFVEMTKNNRLLSVRGPLAGYRNHIVKLRYRYREAIVELEMFGKKRHIRFGLWGKGDPELPWLIMDAPVAGDVALDSEIEIDIGLHPGDRVTYPEVYGDMIFVIDEVDPVRRTIRTKIELFGASRSMEMYADDAVKI